MISDLNISSIDLLPRKLKISTGCKMFHIWRLQCSQGFIKCGGNTEKMSITFIFGHLIEQCSVFVRILSPHNWMKLLDIYSVRHKWIQNNHNLVN